MTTPIHVLGFSGSLRKASYNTALLRAAGDLVPEGMSLEIFDIAPIPLYNQDLESALPPSVQEFKARIAAADAILIATPEYNYSVPGVLKNAIDWASRPPDRPLNNKPGAMMGASSGLFGTVRAQHHLRQILQHTNVLALNKPEVYVPQAQNKFDSNGQLTDEITRGFVKDLLVALAEWTRRLRSS